MKRFVLRICKQLPGEHGLFALNRPATQLKPLTLYGG